MSYFRYKLEIYSEMFIDFSIVDLHVLYVFAMPCVCQLCVKCFTCLKQDVSKSLWCDVILCTDFAIELKKLRLSKVVPLALKFEATRADRPMRVRKLVVQRSMRKVLRATGGLTTIFHRNGGMMVFVYRDLTI